MGRIDRILAVSQSDMTSTTSQRSILIIAGPNGAGKTTFATEFPKLAAEGINDGQAE